MSDSETMEPNTTKMNLIIKNKHVVKRWNFFKRFQFL